jgi:two-component system cell cycle sensor histidine kinase/response regulator CckA
VETTKHKVVVVEDEGLIAADLKGRLEAAGYSVGGTAGTGGEALKVIRETSPDVVLMDIHLRGDVDGIQVADQVRREFDVPVVYLTAYEDRGTLERASQTQAFGYIKKPIATASLQGSIEMAIAKHQHERYLREQRDWFSASFAAVPDGVIVTDGLGGVCYLNHVAEELTGWKTDDALGHLYTELLKFEHERSGRPVDDLVPAAMLQGESIPLPHYIRLRRDGERSYAIEGTVAPKWNNGRIDGAVVVFKDVTASRFETDQSHIDNKQEALTRLAKGIAQHLDLDLSMVADESARLVESLPVDSPLRQTAKTIEKAANDAFAAACRLQAVADPPESRAEPVSLNDVLTRLESAWKRVLPSLSVRLDPNPRPVLTDSWQLTRALVGVLLHARNWMDAGAGLSVEVSRAEHEPMRQWVRIRVSYPSALEDPESLERAFEPSWSGEPEELPMSYALIRKMNGLLAARLEGGGMVYFDIYLPQVESAVAAATPGRAGEPAVMLVEPNSEVRRILASHFEQHGYGVLEAATCGEALLLAELYDGPIPLAIANPGKGNETSKELTAALHSLKPGVSVRLLDGYWEEPDRGGPSGSQPGYRFLTKWDILEWAKKLGPDRLPAADCVSAGK